MDFIDRLIPRDFRSQVRGPLLRLYLATIINCFGNGMAFSVFVVYLHNIRGFSITFATLLLGISAIVGLCVSPLWGTLASCALEATLLPVFHRQFHESRNRFGHSTLKRVEPFMNDDVGLVRVLVDEVRER